MSLYYVQKLIYNLNRDPDLVIKFQEDMSGVLAQYELTIGNGCYSKAGYWASLYFWC